MKKQRNRIFYDLFIAFAIVSLNISSQTFAISIHDLPPQPPSSFEQSLSWFSTLIFPGYAATSIASTGSTTLAASIMPSIEKVLPTIAEMAGKNLGKTMGSRWGIAGQRVGGEVGSAMGRTMAEKMIQSHEVYKNPPRYSYMYDFERLRIKRGYKTPRNLVQSK